MDKQHRATFDNQLIELESVDSTNNYAMAQVHAGLASGGQVYFAHRQWAGKGQRGRAWTSEPGQNISMSLVLDPGPLLLSSQFLLGAATALGCLNEVRKYVPGGWTVKWPNDIYQSDRKAAGILIENVIKGNDWRFAVIGVGINLNQTSFPSELPHAISLKQISGRSFEPLALARELVTEIGVQVDLLKSDPQIILNAFNQNLYKRGEMVSLRKGNILFETRVESVNPEGRLVTGKGAFIHGEVEFAVDRI
ncbi:MAG: biotin--[acetyl-CoA-carboxylase] ligase [Bacteroidota bacterium]|nr:biotin--[acetyl-CoA-carboxylase] ligase [Bacteroidota bacterium]